MNISFTKYGNMQYLINDFYIAQSLKKNEMYEEFFVENYLKKYIEQSYVILDIGSHIGCHTVMYSKINPKAIIYSFEMQKELYKLLKCNTINLHNIHIFNVAIGNKIKMITQNNFITDGPNFNQPIEYYTDKSFNYGGLSIGYNGEECMMISIDSLQLTKCDFIKIDVEGFEYGVILGALNTILKFKPVIFYEQNPDKPFLIDHCKITDIDENSNINVESFLRSLGYTDFKEIGMNILAT